MYELTLSSEVGNAKPKAKAKTSAKAQPKAKRGSK